MATNSKRDVNNNNNNPNPDPNNKNTHVNSDNNNAPSGSKNNTKEGSMQSKPARRTEIILREWTPGQVRLTKDELEQLTRVCLYKTGTKYPSISTPDRSLSYNSSD